MCDFGTITSPVLAFIGVIQLGERLIKRAVAQEKVLIEIIFARITFGDVMIQEVELAKALCFIQELDDIFYIFILSSVLFHMRARALV